MTEAVKRVLISILGWAFIVLGIAGLFLPIVQGGLFIFIGLYLLSRDSAWAKVVLCKVRDRFPQLFAKFLEFKEIAKRFLRGLLNNRLRP